MFVSSVMVTQSLLTELRRWRNEHTRPAEAPVLCFGETQTRRGAWGPPAFAIGVMSRFFPLFVNNMPQTPVHFVTFEDVECGLVGFEDIEGDEVHLDWIDGKVVRIG